MHRTLALLVLVTCVMGRTAFADPITFIVHDFDSLPVGVQSFNEQNLSLFTSFDGTVATGIEVAASPFAGSSPNVVRGFVPGSAVLGRFLSTEGPQLTLATRLLFVDITGPTDEANPWRFSIFDREGSLLASQTSFIPVGLGFFRSGGPEIASFLFEPGLPLRGLDNVTYTPPVVPEPATMLLVGSGLAAAAWRRRRQSAARIAG
jgi:hypothetical protein